MSKNEKAEKVTKVPGYVAFVKELEGKFRDLGIPLVSASARDKDRLDGIRGPAGWALFEVDGTGDKLYLSRTASGAPSRAETTVPVEELPSAVVIERVTDNGKITCRVDPLMDHLVQLVLPVLLQRLKSGDTIRQSVRRPKAAPVTASTQE